MQIDTPLRLLTMFFKLTEFWADFAVWNEAMLMKIGVVLLMVFGSKSKINRCFQTPS